MSDAFDEELAALIERAHQSYVPHRHLQRLVMAFYRKHGRELPSPFAVPEGPAEVVPP